MGRDRTRAFKGTYTSNDKKQHPFNVRIFKRLATFGLGITLVHASLPGREQAISSDNLQDSFKLEEFNDDKNLIQSIIDHDPNILKDVSETTYVVKKSDTLESIAQENGTTVERICFLNAIDPSATLYEGGTLMIESINEKSDLDKKIAALESYFYDYVFKSPVAEIATSEDPKLSHQRDYFRSLMFGNPKTPADVDPSSFFGQYIHLYLSFHEGNETKDEDAKKEHIEKLTDLADTVNVDLNLGGSSQVIVPFEMYMSYLENGTAKEIKQNKRM